jgi:hypothetical protein
MHKNVESNAPKRTASVYVHRCRKVDYSDKPQLYGISIRLCGNIEFVSIPDYSMVEVDFLCQCA